MEKTDGHIVKLKSDVGKTSNDLNAFKTEMDKHLTNTNFENRINKLEQEFQKLSSDVKHISSTQEETHVKTVATVSSDLEKQIDAKLESVPWQIFLSRIIGYSKISNFSNFSVAFCVCNDGQCCGGFMRQLLSEQT